MNCPFPIIPLPLITHLAHDLAISSTGCMKWHKDGRCQSMVGLWESSTTDRSLGIAIATSLRKLEAARYSRQSKMISASGGCLRQCCRIAPASTSGVE